MTKMKTIPSSEHKDLLCDEYYKISSKNNCSRGQIALKNRQKKALSRLLATNLFWSDARHRKEVISTQYALFKKADKSVLALFESIFTRTVPTKYSSLIGAGRFKWGETKDEKIKKALYCLEHSVLYLDALNIKYSYKMLKKHLRYLFASYFILRSVIADEEAGKV